jgi:hypothetical protein
VDRRKDIQEVLTSRRARLTPDQTGQAGFGDRRRVTFNLSADKLTAIDALDTGQRGGSEPEAITLEAFGRPIPED